MSMHFLNIKGAGGGGKGGSQKNDKNSLRANSTAQVLYLLGEGQIKGIVGGLKGLILDDTFVKNQAGETAIDGVTMYERAGLPTQTPIDNFDGVFTEINVNVKVEQASPITRNLTDEDFTSVVVTIGFPAMVKSTDKGMKRTSVSFRIEARYDQGPWVNALGDQTVSGKNTSPYAQQYRIQLPVNPSGQSNPWQIKVTRLTGDSDDEKLQNDIYFSSMTGVIDTTLQYPDSALLGLVFDATKFDSSSIPAVEAIVDGMYLQVPTNYDPDTHTYSGVWDGTFKYAFSNDPAWFYYTMATNRRFGIGKFLDASAVDKWTLYAISQTCNEMVSDGYGGLEPRFEVNAYITEDMEVYEMMQLIASAFRGMSYWGSGAITATQDVLSDPKQLVTRSGVVDGELNYQSSSITARHTVVHVKYRDKRDDYKNAIEVVRDYEGMRRYGERIKEIDGFGITSRAAANRLGRWVLYTELNECSSVAYQATFDHGVRRPGDIISLMDPEQSNVDYGGRLTQSSAAAVTIDRPIDLNPAHDYTLHCTMPDGSLASRPITSTGNGVQNLTVSPAFPDAPINGAQWIVSSSVVEPKPWRIVSVVEREKHIFEIAALEVYNPKYSLIDSDVTLDLPNYRDPLTPDPPSDLTSKEIFYYDNGVPTTQIMFSWTPPSNQAAPLFKIEIDTPDTLNEYVVDLLSDISFTIDNTQAGDYTIRVYSLSLNARYRSAPATYTFTAAGLSASPTFVVSDIAIVGEVGNEFFAPDVTLTWKNTIAGNSSAADIFFQQNEIVVYDNTDPGTPVEMGTYYGVAPFTYSIRMNQGDAQDMSPAKPSVRDLLFKIRAQDTTDRWGLQSNFAAVNNPLDAPSFVVDPAVGVVLISTAYPPTKDVVGQVVHIGTTAGFVPGPSTEKYRGSSSTAVIPLAPGEYFVKVGLYDSFDADPVNYSTAVGFTIEAITVDTEAPDTPTGLTANSSLLDNGMARVVWTWTANTELDLNHYDLLIKQNAGNFIGYSTATNEYAVDVFPGDDVTAKLRAVDNSGNVSGYTAEVDYTALTDSAAPDAPTGLVASAGLAAIWLKWDANDELDLDHYQVWENTSDNSGTATLIAETSANAVARTGLALNSERWYWIKAVDTSGNVSGFSTSAHAATGSVPTGETFAVEGILFSPNSGVLNRLSWSAGSISYGPPGVAPETFAISAGQVDWTSGTQYVYYVHEETVLRTATSLATVYSDSGYLVGIYKGGTNFQLVDGRALVDGNTIIAGTIGATALVTGTAVITGTAQIADAIITNAKVTALDASKITAGTALAGSITVSGTALSTIQSQADDPAARVNAKTTQIDPGKILISGGTTLANWRGGTDTTKINGGSLEANSVATNTLKVGSRGITVWGLDFSVNKSTNTVSWTAGSITYMNDAGTTVTVAISAGSAVWSSGTRFIYWVKDATALSTGTVATTANADNNVVLASYSGAAGLRVTYGGTIIDGTRIVTGTITADQIAAQSITGDLIAANTITGAQIAAGTITAKNLLIGDFSNLLPDSSFNDRGAWTISTVALTASSFQPSTVNAAIVADRVVQWQEEATGLAASAFRGDLYSDYIPVSPSKDYNLEYTRLFTSLSDGNFEVRVLRYDQTKTLLGTTTIGGSAGVPVTSPTKFTSTLTTDATAAYIRVQIRKQSSAAGVITGTSWIYGVSVRGATSVTIADGSITAVKLSVSTLSAITANAGTITAGLLRSSDSKMQVDLTNKRIVIAD